MDEQRLNDFLRRIGQIETSGGRNLNHKTLDHGMHKGDAALGTYGFMPNTIDEMLTRMKNEHTLPDELKNLVGKQGDDLKQAYYSSPEVENKLAHYMANRVLDNQGGDELKAAYSWYHGHNLSPDKITEDKINKADYTQKYKKLLSNDESESKRRALNNLIYGPQPTQEMVADVPVQIPEPDYSEDIDEDDNKEKLSYLADLFGQ